MCDFCEKIYSNKDAYDYVKNTVYPPYVVIGENNGKYTLWNSCDDPYYSGVIMDINFCPVCGRQLVDVYFKEIEE